MDGTVVHHLEHLLQSLFPTQSHIRARQDKDNLIIAIDWPLKKYKDRPHKRSRLICIICPKNALEEYKGKTELQQTQIDEKLVGFVHQKLENFNPDHDTPYGKIPPQEEWTIVL